MVIFAMNIEDMRNKLRFRSWHRGTKEMDLLMGRFADYTLPSLDETGLVAYARFLEENDPDLYDFYCDRLTIADFDPEVSRDLLERFKTFICAQ